MIKQLNKVTELRVSYKANLAEMPIIHGSKNSYEVLKHFFPFETIQLQEIFVVMYLNKLNRVIGVYPASIGGLDKTIVDLRLVLAVALKSLSTSIILSHNHPSGSLKPSQNDIGITAKIKQAAKLIDIEVLDHIILTTGVNRYFSFADEGLM